MIKKTLRKIDKSTILLIFICLLAFGLHYIGLDFGRPLIVHADEPTIINSVVAMTHNRTFDPGHYERPDLILIYLNFIILNLISYIHYGASIAHAFAGNEFQFYLWGRVITALCGAMLPLVAYKIGKQGKIDFSIPAAILFAVFPAFTIHSHYITPDIPVTLFTLLIILFSIHYIKNGDNKYLWISSILAAVNTAEKYPGVISLGIVFLAILVKEIQMQPLEFKQFVISILKKCLLVTLIFIAALYIIAPILFINYSQVLQAIAYERRTEHLGADNLGWLGNLLYYAREFQIQTPIVLFLFLGIGIYAFIKKKNEVLIPVLFGFIYWVIISIISLHWERWALPMYISPLLFCALGFQFVQNAIQNNTLKVINATLFIGCCGLLLLHSLSASITLSYTDTRKIAAQYCAENGITADNTIYTAYTPFTPIGGGNIYYDMKTFAQDISSRKYILLSSDITTRYYAEPQRYADLIGVFESVKQKYPLIQEIAPTTTFPLPLSIPLPTQAQNIGYWLDNILYYLQKTMGTQNLNQRSTGPTFLIYQVTN